MRLREQSEVGFLMLQWLGVLVPTAFRDEVRAWGGTRSAGKTNAIRSEVFDVDRRVEDATTFEVGEVMTWPNVESMLRGELPEGYDAALLRHAVAGDGVAVTRVDPATGTVTVSRPRCPGCGAVLGGTYGSVCMNCDVET